MRLSSLSEAEIEAFVNGDYAEMERCGWDLWV